MSPFELQYDIVRRYRYRYRDKNLYATVAFDDTGHPIALDFHTENTDQFRTIAGLELIGNLVTTMLEWGVDLDAIKYAVATASIQKNDIPDIVLDILTKATGE